MKEEKKFPFYIWIIIFAVISLIAFILAYCFAERQKSIILGICLIVVNCVFILIPIILRYTHNRPVNYTQKYAKLFVFLNCFMKVVAVAFSVLILCQTIRTIGIMVEISKVAQEVSDLGNLIPGYTSSSTGDLYTTLSQIEFITKKILIYITEITIMVFGFAVKFVPKSEPTSQEIKSDTPNT